MIGRYLAPAYLAPRRWILHHWGVPDIHTRQQWHAVWPRLQRHAGRPLHLLDAGCGEGMWSLELARRFPHWRITALDRDRRALERGRGLHRRLPADNLEWAECGFLSYRPDEPFDLILSVSSAHYMIEAGLGAELFDRFCEWLVPGGELILVIPRCLDEIPASCRLPFPTPNRRLTTGQLVNLIRRPGFATSEMIPFVGPLGARAKQLDMAAAGRPLLQAAAYPLEILLNAFDRLPQPAAPATQSAFWLLRLRKQP